MNFFETEYKALKWQLLFKAKRLFQMCPDTWWSNTKIERTWISEIQPKTKTDGKCNGHPGKIFVLIIMNRKCIVYFERKLLFADTLCTYLHCLTGRILTCSFWFCTFLWLFQFYHWRKNYAIILFISDIYTYKSQVCIVRKFKYLQSIIYYRILVLSFILQKLGPNLILNL